MLPLGFFRRKAARLDLRNHRKIAVLDGRIAYVGSQNIVDADFKRGIVYEELVARVTGPVVHELQAVLLADRYFETETEATEEEERFPALDHTGDVEAQTLPSGPGYPFENNLRLVVALLFAAQKRVVMTTPYFIPDDTLLQAMTTAAQRGVEVHLVVSSKADQCSSAWRSGRITRNCSSRAFGFTSTRALPARQAPEHRRSGGADRLDQHGHAFVRAAVRGQPAGLRRRRW